MLEKLIKRLENEGKLKKQRAGIVQVEAMLKDAKEANSQLEFDL